MDVCRNNVGNWPTHVHATESGLRHDRQYYDIKDLAMAKDANCGFMIWDGTSKGTLTNVVSLLKIHKKVLLYSAPKKDFFTLRTREDLDQALTASGIKDVENRARLRELPTLIAQENNPEKMKNLTLELQYLLDDEVAERNVGRRLS
jgi:hypothetical protein